MQALSDILEGTSEFQSFEQREEKGFKEHSKSVSILQQRFHTVYSSPWNTCKIKNHTITAMYKDRAMDERIVNNPFDLPPRSLRVSTHCTYRDRRACPSFTLPTCSRRTPKSRTCLITWH